MKCTGEERYGTHGEFPGGPVLGLHVFTTEGPGSIPGRGTKIPQAMQPEKKKKKRHGIHETGESMGKEMKRNIRKVAV